MRKKLLESNGDITFLLAEGFDDAILGYCGISYRVIYSVRKCIDILMSRGMSEEDALDHFYYEIECGYVGEFTPIWCQDLYF